MVLIQPVASSAPKGPGSVGPAQGGAGQRRRPTRHNQDRLTGQDPPGWHNSRFVCDGVTPVPLWDQSARGCIVGPQTYLDFDVAVSRHGDELGVRVLGSPAGETMAVRSPWPDAPSHWGPEGIARSSRRLSPSAAAAPEPDEGAASEAADDRSIGS